jgi:glycosyltransferase involved in cell wall biosynthesis
MTAAPAPDLSVVLPSFRGGDTVRRTIVTLLGYLPTVSARWEIILVLDGDDSFPDTWVHEDPRVRVLRHTTNRGKGAAVRTGMLAARGDVRLFTDVDLPYDRELIPVMTTYIRDRGFHLVIGDRTLLGSDYQQPSGARRFVSSVGSFIIGSLVTGGFHDTQCGIKAMRGDVADMLFPLVQTDGFAFDVEVIYLALKHGLDVKRLPVRLRRNESSSVRPLRDAVRATRDISAIKWRQLRGGYVSPGLAELVRSETDLALR